MMRNFYRNPFFFGGIFFCINFIPVKSGEIVEFDAAMTSLPKFRSNKFKDISFYKTRKKARCPHRSDKWNFFKNLYNEHVLNLDQGLSGTVFENTKIPKIIHQIWLGSPFPEEYEHFRQSWLDCHPTWEYKLWTEAEIEKLELKNKSYYDQARNYGEMSDIARYEILYRFGGLYIDTDFECLQPFDVLNELCDFYVGLIEDFSFSEKRDCTMLNGLIASVPEHPILKEAIDSMHIDYEKSGANETIKSSGPLHLMDCFRRYSGEGVCVAFPSNYFYPWPNHMRFEKNLKKVFKWIKPESFAVHYWEVSWIKKEKK